MVSGSLYRLQAYHTGASIVHTPGDARQEVKARHSTTRTPPSIMHEACGNSRKIARLCPVSSKYSRGPNMRLILAYPTPETENV